jgi:hypothetical protein
MEKATFAATIALRILTCRGPMPPRDFKASTISMRDALRAGKSQARSERHQHCINEHAWIKGDFVDARKIGGRQLNQYAQKQAREHYAGKAARRRQY